MAEAESPAGTRDADLLLPLRNEDGEISAAFLEAISRAVETADVPQVRALAGDLHEADLGDLIEALETEQRPRLVELLGSDFDFAALTEVEQLPTVVITAQRGATAVATVQQLPRVVIVGHRETQTALSARTVSEI